MTITLGFDVYGTLIDTAGVTIALQEFAGHRAVEFSDLWRTKQLEYSFRRGLMQNYRHFGVCTKNGLDYTCSALGIDIPEQDKEQLMAGYRVLPAFPDVLDTLPKLKSDGFRLFAFSNGKPGDVANLLENSGISSYFEDVVSTDEIKSFKPNPAVYAHFLRRSGAKAHAAWLISGNPFDVIGAISAGMSGAWVKRSEKAVYDPWEILPTLTISSMSELAVGVKSV
jgi:2-haloacid dehalogenase